MERLTKRFENGRTGLAGNGTPCENMCKYPIVIDRLAAYEDLGPVEELTALKERTRWIPVSERLPESETEVFILAETSTGHKVITTAEAIGAVRDYMVQECLGGLDCSKATNGGYAWTLKDGRTVELRVSIFETPKEAQS